MERSPVELSGRGAGIVTHDVRVEALVACDRDGARVAPLPHPQVVTSRDRVHRSLRDALPAGRDHLGSRVAGHEDGGDAVRVGLSNDETREADLLVGADGFRSAVRARMLPEVGPTCSGHVVRRALAPEAALPEPGREAILPAFASFAAHGTQIIGYPIAGPGNDRRPGHRRYDFVLHAKAEGPDDMPTDAEGIRHAASIPPPPIRDDVLAAMREDAEARLPAPFPTILDHSERPLSTPIHHHHSAVTGSAGWRCRATRPAWRGRMAAWG